MKKLILAALALAACSLFATSAFAQTCLSSNPIIQFIGVGSSAQANSLAYGAQDIIGTGYHLFSVTGKDSNSNNTVVITDTRPTTALNDSPTLWVMWDSAASGGCNVYAYYNIDSVIGVKDFFAYKKLTVGTKTFNVAAAFGIISSDVTTANFSGTLCNGSTKCTTNKVGGLLDTDTSMPSVIYTALANPVLPTGTNNPPKYCGGTTVAASGVWCYFNAGVTDIRPEDALFATTRALGTIPTTGSVNNLGYNNATCGAGAYGTAANQGCVVYDSFGGGKYFYPLNFKLTGTDPFTGATLPKYTALSVGAAPLVVLVANGDTSADGFGHTVTDGAGHTNYTFNNINREVLARVFDGTYHCTSDLLPALGTGKPIQAVNREILSGTYNTFEFTAARRLGGSGNPFIAEPTAVGWFSESDGGQERGAPNGPTTLDGANNPAIGWSGSGASAVLSTACGGPAAINAGLTVAPNGTAACGDPLFIETTSASSKCGVGGLRLRAIGTGLEVPAALGLKNSGASVVTNGIGYTFSGYGNLAPTASGCAEGGNSQYTGTGCTWLGHYLDVDGVDPFFATPGGEFDETNGLGPLNNLFGAYNPPQCNLSAVASGAACPIVIPFTHIYDGTYPLWSVLRIATFVNSGTTLATPPAVLALIAHEESQVAAASRATGDFVPMLKNINLTTNTGDLNLFVFRSHFKQTGGPNNPGNGHSACNGVFTGIQIVGGSTTSATCLIDNGSDEGGSVTTVQSDIDFTADFGSLFNAGSYEVYGIRQ